MSDRLFRLLLRLYPKRFRERFGSGMVEFHRERLRIERERAPIGTWLRIIADTTRSAAIERASELTRSTRDRRDPSLDLATSNSGDSMLSSLWHDVRYASRGMLRRPAFSAVILGTLALGIGANAAIFSVVDGILLNPLPFANVNRIVDARQQDPYSTVSEPEFVDYKRDVRAFQRLAAYTEATATLGGEEPERIQGARVSDGFFGILGVTPEIGRTFTPDEDTPNGARVVVISHGLWQRRFAGDRHIIGTTALIDDAPATIVGVMPARFDFPAPDVTAWWPLRLNTDSLWTRNNHYLTMVGLLSPGATAAQATNQMSALDRQWKTMYPTMYFPDKTFSAIARPVTEMVIGATRPYLAALLGAVAFVLLIACVNVANLLLARGESRRKELAIRTALGASRKRIIRQTLTESALFALGGGALGLLLAASTGRAMLAFAPSSIPRIDEVHLDARVLIFTFVVSLVTGVLFGLVPALRGSRADSASTLREGGRSSTTTSLRSARSVLVVAEVALAVVTLTGAGLMVRSLAKLQSTELGFDPSHVLTMQLSLPQKAYASDERTVEFYRALTERIGRIPGVHAAAAIGSLPMADGMSSWSIMIDGRVAATIAEAATATPEQVTPGYFSAMRIPLVHGRVFTDADRGDAPMVAVVNETMAKQLWPSQSALGHTIKIFKTGAPWMTVIGVVKDERAVGIQAAPLPTMYVPHAQAGKSAYYTPRGMSVVIRTEGDPESLAGAARAAVREIDPHVPISLVRSMEDIVSTSIASRRFSTTLLAVFAVLALVLAGIGIYGVIAFGVSQRTYEIGLRMALGAQRSSVMALVMTQGMRMAMLGLALGTIGALVVARLLGSLLVGVPLIDLPTLAAVSVALAAVAALACAVPAHRAVSVSPTAALRSE